MYRITEFNDEKPVLLITLYYLRSIYLYLGNPPFLTLTVGCDVLWAPVHIQILYWQDRNTYIKMTYIEMNR